MKKIVWLLGGSSLLLAVSSALAIDLPNFEAAARAPSVQAASTQRAVSGGTVTSTDTQRGVPTVVWAARDGSVPLPTARTPEAAAWRYLSEFADLYRLSEAAMATVVLERVHQIGQGPIIAILGQRLGDIEVMHSQLKVVMNQDLELIALTGNLHEAAIESNARQARAFLWTEQEALAQAFGNLYGTAMAPGDFPATGESRAGYRYFSLADSATAQKTDVRFTTPARVKKVYYPFPDRIVPAYYLELISAPLDTSSSDAYAFVVDAQTGALLSRQNLTQGVAFNYRVWAEEEGDNRPFSGPQADFAPHPTGAPDGSQPDFVTPGLISMEGFNTNPAGSVDPWLADDATESRGNNVDAYADHRLPDGYSAGDIRATTTSSQSFDRVYDTAQEPMVTEEQIMAAVTQVFYVTNWLHDFYYDSGFNEAAGNAQVRNFNRGGLEGDPLLAEGQDMGPLDVRNNATMTTPADGGSPRMAMFLWSGAEEAFVQVTGQADNLEAGGAAFGPQDYDLTDTLIAYDDGIDLGSDACEEAINDLTGQIAFIDRGTCTFQLKTYLAEQAGAVGVIIANNTAGEGAIGMAASEEVPEVSIPALSVSYEDGVLLRDGMAAGGVETRLFRAVGVERDGTIDSLVIAHEWGHYIHHRLVNCSDTACSGMSEGWGDFNGIFMQLREGDDLGGAYSAAQYVAPSIGSDPYFGIRRVPYSTDWTRNAFTWKHIVVGEEMPEVLYSQYFGDNNESHNAGEVWATMMWEAYTALQSRSTGSSPDFSFDEGRRRMADYLVAGMIAAPNQPLWTEQRDGILAAAQAMDPVDAALMAEAFARRGMGSCAVDAPRGTSDFVGLEESFVVAPWAAITDITLSDDLASCDEDGILDVTETGTLLVTLHNGAAGELVGATLRVESNSPGVIFQGGQSVSLDPISAFDTGYGRFEVSLDETTTDILSLDFNVILEAPEACEPEVVAFTYVRANYDDIPEATNIETVESQLQAWEEDVQEGSTLWARVLEDGIDNHVYLGEDASSLSDVALVSPTLEFGSDPVTLTFQHRYVFEASAAEEGGELIFWDGGVLEISGDDGATWDDISVVADPGYDGTLYTDANNPLGGRAAFTDTNLSWPAMDSVSLNLSTAYAGQQVRIRFRIGTDEAVGATGWELDNIKVAGILNTPFPSIEADSPDNSVWYQDADGDGYGDPNTSTGGFCPAPDGYVANSDDCDDTDADTYPGAPEDGIDGVDHNCDGLVEDPGSCNARVDLPGGGRGGLLSLLPFLGAGLLIFRRRRRE